MYILFISIHEYTIEINNINIDNVNDDDDDDEDYNISQIEKTSLYSK